MEYKMIGNTGVKVSSLCLGTMSFAGTADKQESTGIFNRCRDEGINFIDCAKSRQETIAPIEKLHRSVSIAHLGNIAMFLGRNLKWNPDRERFVDDTEANRMHSRSMRAPWHLNM